MPLPAEVQTLLSLIARRNQLDTRRAALQADDQQLAADFNTLFVSGALGVSEANKFRIVHVRTQGGQVRILLIFWVANVNGVNIAEAQQIDIPEA